MSTNSGAIRLGVVDVTPRWEDRGMTSWNMERAVEALARTHHGAFNRPQAKALGASTKMIETRIANGRWLELGYPVLALPGNPPSWERQAMAATLTLPGAVLSGPPAAALHGYSDVRAAHMHVAVLHGARHHSRLATVHQMGNIESTVVDHIPVLSPAATMFDLVGHLSERRLRTLFHDTVQQRRELLGAVQDRFTELSASRSPALRVIAELLTELTDDDGPGGTELERALDRVLLCVSRLPPVLAEAPFPWRSAAPQRVDRLVEDWKLILEADSRAWHTRVDDFERDRERDNEASIHGYGVLRFTWSKLTVRASEAADQIRRYGARFRSAA
jgi:hypothetical protein